MPKVQRLRALDIFRGVTVAAMIVVNCSGSDDVYPLLEHAPWHGLTLADVVFPSFLFIVGLSAVLSRAARVGRGQKSEDIFLHTAWRSAGLFALGLLVNFVIFREAVGIRWPGVLQRIAICSMTTSAVLMLDSAYVELGLFCALLLGYWALMTRFPVPGHGAGILTPEGNLASWLDRRLMGGHLQFPLEDPEGLLSTLPAIATTLLGAMAGRSLIKSKWEPKYALALGAVGVGLCAAGFAWDTVFPMNKHLWTSSYVLATGGICLALLAGVLVIFSENPPTVLRPLEALGRRALAAYTFTGFVYGVQEFVHARLPDGSMGNVKLWITAHAFLPWLEPKAASLAYALTFTALAGAAALVAERK
jgi:predicted acyltransferase